MQNKGVLRGCRHTKVQVSQPVLGLFYPKTQHMELLSFSVLEPERPD